MTKAQEIGQFAEDRAADYVISLGWKVIARNVKINIDNVRGEIDIAAIDNENELVIIEVRCRTLGKIQAPVDSIGPRKLHSLIKASMELVNNLEWEGFWRIDIIGITLNEKQDLEDWTLEHVRDITAGMNFSF